MSKCLFLYLYYEKLGISKIHYNQHSFPDSTLSTLPVTWPAVCPGWSPRSPAHHTRGHICGQIFHFLSFTKTGSGGSPCHYFLQPGDVQTERQRAKQSPTLPNQMFSKKSSYFRSFIYFHPTLACLESSSVEPRRLSSTSLN